MQPLGYLYKRVADKPDWLKASQVKDIYSLSSCVSADFADYVNYWKHNGFWLFDSPQRIQDLASVNSIDLVGMRLFYYEAHEAEYNENARTWDPYQAESSFGTAVAIPSEKILEGFDVTTFTVGTLPECSPLSCNSCATTISTNQHCLLATFEEAKRAIESNAFHGCEPGPYRIIGVYSVPGA